MPTRSGRQQGPLPEKSERRIARQRRSRAGRVAGSPGLIPALRRLLGAGCAAILLAACSAQQYQERPLRPAQSAQTYLQRSLDDPAVRELFRQEGRNWPPREWDGEALVLAARALNPELAVARSAVAVAEARVREAGAGIDPVISAQTEHHSLRQEGSFWSLGAFIELIFERPARRQARVDRARASLEAERQALQGAIWALRGRVLEAWESLRLQHADLGLQQRRVSLLERMTRLLERRHALGESSGFELDSLRLELLRARLELQRLEAAEREAWRRLAAQVGVTDENLRQVAGEPDVIGERPVGPLPALDRLQREMLHRHHLVLGALHRYAAVEAALRLELEAQYPDLHLSPGYFFDQGDNIWSLAGSLVLPLMKNHTGAIERARREREQEAARFRSVQARLISGLHQAYGTAVDAGEALQQARSLLVAARERERKVQRNQELGETGLVELLRSRLQTLEAESAVSRSRQHARMARLRLEQAAQLRLGEIHAEGAVAGVAVVRGKTLTEE